MTPDAIRSIVAGAGYAARVQKDEVQVHVCWFCANDKWNLELSATKGVFHCWACGTAGRLDVLLHERTGVTVSIPVDVQTLARARHSIASVPVIPASHAFRAMAYLRTRRIGIVEVIRYGIGVCDDPKFELYPGQSIYRRLVLPVRDYWTQAEAGVVARTYRNERPPYLSRVAGPPVGFRAPTSKVHVVVEGWFDGLTVHRAGFNAFVLLGSLTNRDDIEHWVARVPRTDPIVVLLDGDAWDKARKIKGRIRAIRPDVQALRLPQSMDPGALLPDVAARLIHAATDNPPAPTLSGVTHT